MTSPEKIVLSHLTEAGLVDLMQAWGEPAFRGRQVYRQLFVKLAASPAAMTDLPAALRQRLEAETSILGLTLEKVLIADDGLTRKALFRLPDGSPVETVLMVYEDRATVCVSSQSGCPMACVFCATGKLGFLHDLTAGQIVEQVLWAGHTLRTIREERGEAGQALPERVGNIVFMGMGEPFNNFDAWWESVVRIHDPKGLNLGARNFTVSTVGLVPGILRLAQMDLPVNLAISLHAPDDELRNDMMPVNKRYPIAELIASVRTYTDTTHRRVSFEYVLLKEKNDSPEQARALAKLLSGAGTYLPPLLCHVNLIPWNPVPGTPLDRSDRKRVLDFQQVLVDHALSCTVRVERGGEIAAACGQLAGSAT